MTDRTMDGHADEDGPYPETQVLAEKSLMRLKGTVVSAEAWSKEYTGLEIHLDGAADLLIIHGTIDDEGRRATVGSWISPENAREFGEALIEAADRVEAAREERDGCEEREQDKGTLARVLETFTDRATAGGGGDD